MSSFAPDWGGLVLFRKAGEEILVRAGKSELIIVVEAVGGGRCQLRFVADDSVEIQRGEVVRRDNDKESGR
jgi:sRNA-binding carbon storage regulator CsrA